MNQQADTAWEPIESAPKDTELLVYTTEWGTIIAQYSGEFSQWLSRMQVPVSIQAEDAPTHWQALPSPPSGQA